MFFAIAALLIHPQIAPPRSFSAEKIALVQPANSMPASNAAVDSPQPPATSVAATAVAVRPVSGNVAPLPDAPTPASAVDASVPTAFLLAKPSKPATVSVRELLAENRRKQLLWKGLAVASSGAATFDAWSTRRAITTSGAQELNPLLRPFAGNASLYAAIQVAPVLMDYAGKKMMYNRHTWVRRMWWAPQSASFISSMFCGSHNLAFH